MNEYLSLISEADAMAICFEQTKHKVELAKMSLESAKQELERVKEAYEEVLSRADQAGLSKNKLKKLVEERIQELATLGLAEWTKPAGDAKVKKPAAPKAPRASRKNASTEEVVESTMAESEIESGDVNFNSNDSELSEAHVN